MPSNHIPVASNISMYTPDQSECKNIPLWLAKSPEFADALDRLLLAPPAAEESTARLAWAKSCAHSAATCARQRIKLRLASSYEECHHWCMAAPRGLRLQYVRMIDNALVCYLKLAE
eukprot:1152263-Pyramimonas_sp.AAC.1